ncbi:MAG: Na+/H+ antiporter NhaA [Bacteroidaceae bacterium]|nr:Na+/H+ antiporter NhaA [Bacteroidaceae bacterium]
MRLIPLYTWTKGLHTMEISQKAFMHRPWASGVTLLACVIVAMLLANLPFTAQFYHEFLETDLAITITNDAFSVSFPHGMTVEKFINDILMVVFFFTVGLEIKREVVCGELSSVKKAMLPVIAAAGGMAAPALFYTFFNIGTTTSGGWGIPTATDIAFAVGIMSILGNKVPVSLKVFLTALAIADDLGAILVVAFFYGGTINVHLLFIAIVLLGVIFLMNKLGEKRMAFYLIPAIVVWFLFYYSGIHSTMSGVVMAFMIPMEARFSRSYLNRSNKKYLTRIARYDANDIEPGIPFPNGMQRHCLRRMSCINNNSIGMSYRLEHALNPWVNFLIMPIFALANAGVVIPDISFFNIFQSLPFEGVGFVGMGIFFGLLFGKPIGITLASFIAIKCKMGAMPEGASWKMLFAVACLGGIGFTMAIFVDTLSFGEFDPSTTEMLRSAGKIAVLLGSLCAGVMGSALICLFHKVETRTQND